MQDAKIDPTVLWQWDDEENIEKPITIFFFFLFFFLLEQHATFSAHSQLDSLRETGTSDLFCLQFVAKHN